MRDANFRQRFNNRYAALRFFAAVTVKNVEPKLGREAHRANARCAAQSRGELSARKVVNAAHEYFKDVIPEIGCHAELALNARK